MSNIILDFGSGNSSCNDRGIIREMYDELKAVDTGKHRIYIKWQLFEKAGDNIPLLPESFEYAYEYGTSLGYEVTSSVFDKNSLDFLLNFDVPFVKIANNRKLDWLIGFAPRNILVVVSYGSIEDLKTAPKENIKRLLCVSEYPADILKYEAFDLEYYIKSGYGISDHTTDFTLFNKYHPDWIEMHYKLADSTGLDAGPFAKTAEQFAEIL